MPDTPRNEAALLSLFSDNTRGDIDPQDVRDLIVSIPTLVQDAGVDPGAVPFTDLYIAVDSGDDTNDGLTALTPIETIEEAITRLNQYAYVKERCVVHMNTGVHELRSQLLPHLLQAPLIFIGDGAGQSGDDGFVELETGVLQAGSGRLVAVTTGGMTADAYAGKTIEIVDGVCAGMRRSIRNHDETDITPSAPFALSDTISPAPGDAYRILESSVVLGIGGWIDEPTFAEFYAKGVGNFPGFLGCGTSINNTSPYSIGSYTRSYIGLINLKITEIPGDTLEYPRFSIRDSSILMLGVELGDFTVDSNAGTQIHSGMDHVISGVLGEGTGLTSSPYLWGGWGTYFPDGSGFLTAGGMFGVFGVKGQLYLTRGEIALWGGFVDGGAATELSLILTRVTGSVGTPGDIPVLVRNEYDGTKGCCVYVAGASGEVMLQGIRLEKSEQGCCLLVETDNSGQWGTPSRVSLTGSVECVAGDVVPDHAIIVSGGCSVQIIRTSNTFTGFDEGTELAVKAYQSNGPLIEACDVDDLDRLNEDAVLPFITDGRHGYIRRI